MSNIGLKSLAVTLTLGLTAVAANAQSVPSKTLGDDRSSQISSPSNFSDFVPEQRILKKLRPVKTPSLEQSFDPKAPLPLVMPGQKGGQVAPNTASDPVGSDIAPQNYGAGQLNTINHYSDNLVPNTITSTYPYRTTGWFTFTTWDDQSKRCSAALISKSILLTAGHCVHKGGGGQAYYIKSGTFYPAYADGTQPYGYATANTIYTTSGWANTGALDQGYDVALVVLNKRQGTTREMGSDTGTLAFCYENCLQQYWQNTQLGYPGNYYKGQFMTEGRHLEYSDNRDYRSGSGMEGGSSGGPHIANMGEISDISGNAGQYTHRNVAFAVTSWGYSGTGTPGVATKLQGYSSTSGPRNANNFKAMYNNACTRARTVHGTSSCSLLR